MLHLYKKGNRSDPKNYHPVSLTSLICKTMEHILVSQIMKHLESNNILIQEQHGFRSQHSCEAQLFLTTNDLAKAIDDKVQVDMAILDFSKAFDKVAHNRLKHKLDFYGIRGNLLGWLESFLSNRTQQVVVGGTYSSCSAVTSGVPQGSVLGPVLFLLYINDITTNIHSQLRLFADDCLVYRLINSTDDHQIFQSDLDTLSTWTRRWQMEFNVSKCKILQVSTCYTKSLFSYQMCGTPLEIVEQHNYLGICLHHRLSWQPYIDSICNKANRLLGFLHRNLRHCPNKLKECAYKQMILPILEYCSPIWDPYQQRSIHKIEMIQHRAARFVLNQPWNRHHRGSISEMLQSLKWPSLQARRKQARLIFLFKILNGLICIPNQSLPSPFRNTTTRSRHPNKLQQLYTRTDIYHYSFLPRTIPDWNNLRIDNINELDLIQFKDFVMNI